MTHAVRRSTHVACVTTRNVLIHFFHPQGFSGSRQANQISRGEVTEILRDNRRSIASTDSTAESYLALDNLGDLIHDRILHDR